MGSTITILQGFYIRGPTSFVEDSSEEVVGSGA
jgi:hypothetical protein